MSDNHCDNCKNLNEDIKLLSARLEAESNVPSIIHLVLQFRRQHPTVNVFEALEAVKADHERMRQEAYDAAMKKFDL